jgi:hypothetical protein
MYGMVLYLSLVFTKLQKALMGIISIETAEYWIWYVYLSRNLAGYILLAI